MNTRTISSTVPPTSRVPTTIRVVRTTPGDQPSANGVTAAVTAVEPDWVALHQVPVNGRAAGCTVRQTQVEVSRDKALSTLTVHKVFRRAEIERHARFRAALAQASGAGVRARSRR